MQNIRNKRAFCFYINIYIAGKRGKFPFQIPILLRQFRRVSQGITKQQVILKAQASSQDAIQMMVGLGCPGTFIRAEFGKPFEGIPIFNTHIAHELVA